MEHFENRSFDDIRVTDVTVENMRFSDCVFNGCRAENVTFRNCSFLDCVFNDCAVRNIRSDVSVLRGAEFLHCRLFGLNFAELGGGGPFDQPLYRLERCELRYCYFINMELRRFGFSSSSMTDCEFSSCDLQGRDLSGCDLSGAVFTGCDLRECDFRGAAGYSVDITSNKLKGAAFSLPEAVRLLGGLGIKVE